MPTIEKLRQLWIQLYGEANESQLTEFIDFLEVFRQSHTIEAQQPEWYKDAIVYSLYIDLFNNDFKGLTDKLNYLKELGVNCLWLLPILDSPMRDAGFDIRNYTKVRDELMGLPANAGDEEKYGVFKKFIDDAHKMGIRVIFDIAMNHTSEEHPWFVEARKSEDNPFRNFYIWSKDTDRYKDARIIFKGMETSNWEPDGHWNFFHRFFSFQPDLNYRNPQVLIEMSKNLLFWLGHGVDGFRVDAIPYLWKEEGTDCENLPQTHAIVKFFRAVVDYVRPHTLLLAEACQKPVEVIKYFGTGDECHAGYHFPLMPQMFKAIAMQSREPIMKTLSKEVTPDIPDTAQWFTFLRCHDELSLELVYVSEEDRAYIHSNYCLQTEWNFREGEGISARLSELMGRNPDKIALSYSVMLTLPGTPIIYYGDEFGKVNDEHYYKEKIKETGKDDTRFLVRGRIDWKQLAKDLKDNNSLSAKVHKRLSRMIQLRRRYKAFGRGSLTWIEAKNQEGNVNEAVMVYLRKLQTEQLLIVHNLSEQPQSCRLKFQPEITWTDMFGNQANYDEKNQLLHLKPYEYLWFKV
ncbi:MAG: alpha-glucosidase C-terminal domain-containing protein [Bacteroidales bacterium]|nr:alpha-glucosidase C-terminal domain-containing protein [Bacteroidales bacterium]